MLPVIATTTSPELSNQPVFLMFQNAQEIRCPHCKRLAGTILGLCMFVTVCRRCGRKFAWPSLESRPVEGMPISLLQCYVGGSTAGT